MPQPAARGPGEAAEEAWRATPDVQRFKMVNRRFLYTNSGAYSTAAFGVLWSPFTSGQFVRAALRLHPDIVHGQRAYLTWLAERFPKRCITFGNATMRNPCSVRVCVARKHGRKWGARLRRILPLRTPKSMSPIELWLDFLGRNSALLQRHVPPVVSTVATLSFFGSHCGSRFSNDECHEQSLRLDLVVGHPSLV